MKIWKEEGKRGICGPSKQSYSQKILSFPKFHRNFMVCFQNARIFSLWESSREYWNECYFSWRRRLLVKKYRIFNTSFAVVSVVRPIRFGWWSNVCVSFWLFGKYAAASLAKLFKVHALLCAFLSSALFLLPSFLSFSCQNCMCVFSRLGIWKQRIKVPLWQIHTAIKFSRKLCCRSHHEATLAYAEVKG